MKGNFGEKLTNEIVRSENRIPFYSSKHNVNHQGFDNISIDSDGTFVFTEAKFSSSASDVRASLLSASGGVKQLTEDWLRESVSRTTGLSPAQQTELLQAINTKNFRTSLEDIDAPTQTK